MLSYWLWINILQHSESIRQYMSRTIRHTACILIVERRRGLWIGGKVFAALDWPVCSKRRMSICRRERQHQVIQRQGGTDWNRCQMMDSQKFRPGNLRPSQENRVLRSERQCQMRTGTSTMK